MSLFIGIDSGTQSTKAVLMDSRDGRILAEARAPHRMVANLPAGHMEQHPQEWARALDRVIRGVVAKADPKQIRGIGISGQQHGFVPLDAKGEVIRPAKLWCDTSTVRECDDLTRNLGGPKAVLRETGMPFLPGYTAPKILWLKRNEPRNFQRLRHVLLPHDYLNLQLTRDLAGLTMEHGDASGTALLNVRTRQWSRAAVTAVDRNLQGFLPALSSSLRPVGVVHPAVAKRYGFSTGVIVSAGGGDNMMGAIGTGAIRPGVVTASLGTSGTIYAFSERPVVDPRGEIAAFCSSSGGWLPLLCTMNVTLVTEHLRQLLAMDHRRFEQAARKVPPGSDGLLLLPYLDGERTPNLPRATGVLQGITRRNLAGPHLARAAIEGVTLGLNYGLQRLRGLGISPAEIRLTGGGSKSGLWREIAADVFGVPVVCMAAEESAALGAAIQAAACSDDSVRGAEGLRRLCDWLVGIDGRTRQRPDRRRSAVYRALQEKHDRLGGAMKAFFV
jgi:xylulokinase